MNLSDNMVQKPTNQTQGNDTESDRPLTFKDACKYLQCSTSYLYKLTHKRLIPAYKPCGKKLYFKITELNKWLFRNPIKSQSEIEQEAINHIQKSEV